MAVVLAVGVVTTATVTAIGDARARGVDTTAQEARDFAVQSVPTILSYDHNTVDAHFTDALKLLGGDFRAQFDDVSQRVIAPSAKNRQVVTKAQVVDSAIVSATSNDAHLLLFVNQSTTSTDSPATKLDGSRVQVTVSRFGDDWLITEIKPV
ncbi:hypothetical protein [Nocardia wallacei]|uniref:hypothetical protein n=1 Tax=Nocardia wallacei TaxID=480035 RepID=UPI0024586D27|nr:hypothetical protein [Nocardia wallacei]